MPKSSAELLSELNTRAKTAARKASTYAIIGAFLFGFALSAVIFTVPRRPVMKIVTRYEVVDLEGRTNYVIDWVVNGTMALSANFLDPQERVKFEKYLHEMGRVEE